MGGRKTQNPPHHVGVNWRFPEHRRNLLRRMHAADVTKSSPSQPAEFFAGAPVRETPMRAVVDNRRDAFGYGPRGSGLVVLHAIGSSKPSQSRGRIIRAGPEGALMRMVAGHVGKALLVPVPPIAINGRAV